MAKIELSRHIAAPIDEVFARNTNFADAADVVNGITKIEMLTEGDVGKGTRFRETRVMFGKEATEEMEVVGFDPPRSYQLGAESHGSRYLSTFTFTEDGDGTDVHLLFEATPLTLPAKIMSVLMKPMMKTVMKECSKDLDDIKAAIEGTRGGGSNDSDDS